MGGCPDMGTNNPTWENEMLTRGGIFVRNPYLRFIEPDEENGGGGNDKPNEDAPKFPKDTPVKDMKPEEQVAYWQDKARKHEGRVNSYGLTPQQVKDLQAENEKLKEKTLTADEKAIEAAKKAGREELQSQLTAERVDNAFEKALSGRTPDLAAYREVLRNPSLFAKDGKADTAAIKAWVEENSTEAASGGGRKKPVDLGQGNRERITPSRGEAGRAEAAKRFKKPESN